MKSATLSLSIIAMLFNAGCSTGAWYEGVKSRAEHECRSQPGASADECLSRVNRQSYEDYEKARSENR